VARRRPLFIDDVGIKGVGWGWWVWVFNVDGGGPALNRAELAGGDAWTTRCRTTAVVDSSFARHLVSSPLMACDTVSFLFSIR
jgi:hypothetical protein